jgi:hypothetical protein
MANLWLLGSDDPQPDDPVTETQAAEHQTAPKILPSDDSDLKASIAQRIEELRSQGLPEKDIAAALLPGILRHFTARILQHDSPTESYNEADRRRDELERISKDVDIAQTRKGSIASGDAASVSDAERAAGKRTVERQITRHLKAEFGDKAVEFPRRNDW